MAAPAENQNATLLIVDDDSTVRERLRNIFENADYRVVTATEASSALRVLKGVRCDLIALDLEMPGVDGLALCKLLRAQPFTSKLPIIALSESDDETRKVQAFTAGADDYITKPSTPGELLSRVSLHVRTSQREWALIGSNRELRFLSDIGRGLLRALEPEQLVRRVAGATYDATDASLCAAYITVSRDNHAVCVFDREGSADDPSLLDRKALQEWLRSAGSASSLLTTENAGFLLRDELHAVEYVAPLRFAGRAKGALIVAFDNREDCSETERRLIDAAAQQTALAAHICSLYQAARDTSFSLAKEVERRTAETESQKRFIEAIIDSLPLSLYAVDREYRVVAWNRNRELGELGIPRGSALGKNVFKVLTRQPRDVLEQEFSRVFESGEIERIDQETMTDEGEIRHWLISKIPMWADTSGQVTHVITVGEDVTDRVQANRAVARAEKLAAVGRLAAGVVHEINNPLATISACAESLESRLNEGAFDESPMVEDLREYLGLIRSEAFRCKSITNGLLDFSRTRASDHSTLNLGDVITSASRLLSHQQRRSAVEFRLEIADDLSPVLGDAGQLQQAVIALATNALDAMVISGTLTIGAKNDGDKVIVEVTDDGVGIQPENLPKIFEPFFTTKEIGKGTGLGLAVCYGILTEHGGTLDVQSTVGVGTTFTITLPAVNLNEE
ncbi:MAG TPA: response regulator [Pyrinomonadaceae bacterium]|jgi:two-component system NtrC family sensor kinase|nr:response regulator [Pyrinomonadaceae bacterium]